MASRSFFASGMKKISRLFHRDTMSGILHEVSGPSKKATFGMGCFWANDALFGATPGVLRTACGYAGGTTPNPVYRNLGDHTEVIQVDYNPQEITYQQLLDLFWANHEYGLTTVIKRQYMSLILYHDEEQRQIAEASLKEEASRHKEPMVTEVAEMGVFYPAEDYHQKYRLQKHAVLCQELGLTPALLTSSYAATRLNGYLAGVGTEEDLDKDLQRLGLSENIASYVRKQWKENEGGALYC